VIVPDRPERVRSELTDFCKMIRQPIVFVDVRPFAGAEGYPAGTAFVGSDPEEIGERAAQWVAKELLERGSQEPYVLIVGGDAQEGRHVRFEAKLREILPSSKIEVSLLGLFARDRAREIVHQRVRRLHRRGESLSAIFCTNDEMALGAVDAIQADTAAGNRHNDLIVVGVDGIAEAIATIKSDVTPFRATIVQDTRRIAEVTVDLLLRMRAGEHIRAETFLPTTMYPMQ
jgi:ribose transport system substrate-binding protein